MANESRKRKRGRPPGTSNAKPDVVTVAATRCRRCGSTDRERYSRTPIITPFCGVGEDGEPYTHVIRRRTRCVACGQVRIDRFLENRIESKEVAAPNVLRPAA